MGIKWQQKRVFSLGVLLALGTVLGCGSGTPPALESSRRASISLAIQWPQPTRLIPLAAQSIRIELRDANGSLVTSPRLVPRPTVGSSTTVTLIDLFQGEVTVTATAYPNANGTGTAQATGTIPVTLVAGQTVAAALTMSSTIEQVQILGNSTVPLRPGQKRSLSAQARDSAGNTVLVAASQWEWSSSNTAAFSLAATGASATVTGNATGSTTLTLSDKESGKTVTTDVVTGDGLGVAFGSQRGGNSIDVYLVNPDGTGQVRATTSTGAAHYGFALSPDGKKVACTKQDTYFQIYTWNNDGTGETRLTSETRSSWMPRFSPDGKKIVYNREEGPSNKADLIVMNADGSEKLNLTNTPTFTEFVGFFSPDSTFLVYSSNETGDYELYRINTDGTNRTRLTYNSGDDAAFDLSPDGSRILFRSRRDGNDEVYSIKVDGTGQTRLTNSTGIDSQPTFSPDGTKIVYLSEQGGNRDIYVMNADGTGQTRLTTDPNTDSSPRFSPDGTKIVFHRFTDHDTIWVMNADGSDQRNISLTTGTDFDPLWFQVKG